MSGFMQIIRSPWEQTFCSILEEAREFVYLASPFIKAQTAKLISQALKPKLDFKYINCFKLAYFHSGASDLEALRLLRTSECCQKSVHNLHAKVFIIDDKAIVTSSNLTPGGLRNNLEYGVLLKNSQVEQIRADYLDIFNNPDYPEITDEIIDRAESILASVPKEKKKTLRVPESKLFKDLTDEPKAEDRFDGGIQSIIKNLPPWADDVFGCLVEIDADVFYLNQVYEFEPRLSKLHPDNKYVQAKIRQQLQYLRDLGLLEFVTPGIYKKLWI